MDDATADFTRVIGARVRQSRQARHWTLDQLADAAGTSRRSVINVEQGAANPSVGILLKLSDALGIGLPTLVAPPAPKPLAVTRAGEAAVLWSGEYGGQGALVAGTEPPDVVELWDWTMNPGDQHVTEAHATGTHELVHVLAGTLTITIADQSVELHVGDSLSFPGDVDHGYANHHDRAAWFSLTVYEPGVGAPSNPDAASARRTP
jgi:transcriptional regulator with XRE-family HTH domain